MDFRLDVAWKRAVGGLDWLKQVILGEFDETRDLSAIVADMLVSFVPGVVIVTSARDLTAVILRLANHPEKRDDVTEWMLVVGCAIPLMLPIIGAAVGAIGAGVGAIPGAISGSEAGAVLRAVCLLLIKQNRLLAEIVGFLRRFIKGDILAVLRKVHFAQYSDDLVKFLGDFIGKLRQVTQKVRGEVAKLPGFEAVREVLAKLSELERRFYAVQQSAIEKIPQALAELDVRLQKALAEGLQHEPHAAVTGIPAGHAASQVPESARVPTMSDNSLGVPPGTTRPPEPPPPVEPQPNLHPEHVRRPPYTTRPTGTPGSKPTGKRTTNKPNTDSPNKRGIELENQSADLLANHGYKIEQNPQWHIGDWSKPGKKPDYRIEGQLFDNYAPRMDSPRNILDGINAKVGGKQADRIVVNLADSNVTRHQLREAISEYGEHRRITRDYLDREAWRD